MRIELNKDLMPSNINKAVSFDNQLTINTDTGSLIPVVYVSSSMGSSPASWFHNNSQSSGLTVIRKSGEWTSDYFPHYCSGIAWMGAQQGGFLIPHYSRAEINVGGLSWTNGIYWKDKLMCKNNDTTIQTWTPVISALQETDPTVTYTNRIGWYSKIGHLVFFSFFIRGKITALNGTNNYAIVTGLPYTTSSRSNQTGISMGICYSALANETNPLYYIDAYGIRLSYSYGGSAAKWKVTETNYMEVGGSGWYWTDTAD